MRLDYFYVRNRHPWYKLWHRSNLLRDVQWAIRNYRHRQWCKYGKRNLLWLHTTEEYYDEMIKKPLWPRYNRKF